MSFVFKNQDYKATLLAVSAAALLYSTYIHYKGDAYSKDKTGIPTPDSAYPYIGHLLSLGNVPNKKIMKWHAEYGPIIRVRMGVQNFIFISDPYLANKIFSGFGAYSSGRPYSTFVAKQYSSDGEGVIFADDTILWKKARMAVSSVLAPKKVSQYISSIEQGMGKLVESLLNETSASGKLDPFDLLQLTSINIISNVSVGFQYESVNDPDFIKYMDMAVEATKLASVEMDLPLYLPVLKPVTRFIGIEKRMDHFINDICEPFMQKLVKQATIKEGPNIIKEFNKEGYMFTDRQKSVIINELMIAGGDLTACTMYWLLAIICNMPKVQMKLQQELDSFILQNKRLPSFDDRVELRYVTSVIKETIRYNSIGPFNLPHMTKKDIQVDNYKIPANTVLIASNIAMHKKSTHYTNGNIYDPERYMNDTKTMFSSANGNIQDRDHFTFGWGRRVCPGIYLAEVELFTMIVRLFSSCSIETIRDDHGNELIPDLDDNVYFGLTILPKAFQIRVVERPNKLI